MIIKKSIIKKIFILPVIALFIYIMIICVDPIIKGGTWYFGEFCGLVIMNVIIIDFLFLSVCILIVNYLIGLRYNFERLLFFLSTIIFALITIYPFTDYNFFIIRNGYNNALILMLTMSLCYFIPFLLCLALTIFTREEVVQ